MPKILIQMLWYSKIIKSVNEIKQLISLLNILSTLFPSRPRAAMRLYQTRCSVSQIVSIVNKFSSADMLVVATVDQTEGYAPQQQHHGQLMCVRRRRWTCCASMKFGQTFCAPPVRPIRSIPKSSSSSSLGGSRFVVRPGGGTIKWNTQMSRV